MLLLLCKYQLFHFKRQTSPTTSWWWNHGQGWPCSCFYTERNNCLFVVRPFFWEVWVLFSQIVCFVLFFFNVHYIMRWMCDLCRWLVHFSKREGRCLRDLPPKVWKCSRLPVSANVVFSISGKMYTYTHLRSSRKMVSLIQHICVILLFEWYNVHIAALNLEHSFVLGIF